MWAGRESRLGRLWPHGLDYLSPLGRGRDRLRLARVRGIIQSRSSCLRTNGKRYSMPGLAA